MQDLWGTAKAPKGKAKGKGKGMSDPFAKMSLKDMKTSTLTDKKGASSKIFKSIGF